MRPSRWRTVREIAASGMFDLRWYELAYGFGARSGLDPIADYVKRGATLGRRPHRRFEPAWYLEVNDDVRRSGMEPFHHYCVMGLAEGRAPSRWVATLDSAAPMHPLFDADWYAQSNTDVSGQTLDPLAHFIEWGAGELRDPHTMLSCRWYLDRYPDVRASGQRPADHYLDTGWREGRRPNEFFDTDWYRRRYAVSTGVDPLVHFVEIGYELGHVTQAQDEPCVYVPGLEWEANSGGVLASRLRGRLPSSLIGWQGPLLSIPKADDDVPAADSLVRTWRPPRSGSRGQDRQARRALLISHEASLTGAPVYLEQCGSLLVERGFEVLVVSLRADAKADVFARVGLPCLRLAELCSDDDPGTINWLLTPAGRNALSGVIRGFDPAVAIVNSLVAADACGPLVLSDVPIVLQAHESFAWSGARTSAVVQYERAINRGLMAADQVLFGSQQSMDLWRSRQPLLRGRALPTTRTSDSVIGATERADVRSILGLSEGDFLILSVATFEERKRITDIVTAFAHMNEPATLLLLIGEIDRPGIERVAIRDAVEAGHRVVSLPPIGDIGKYYSAADMLAFASEQETYPLALQEAAHARLARVVSRFPGWTESISESSALLFDVGDIQALSAQMRRVVRDTSLRNDLVVAASSEIAAEAARWSCDFIAAR